MHKIYIVPTNTPGYRTLQAPDETWEQMRHAMAAKGYFSEARQISVLLRNASGNTAARLVTVPDDLARVILACAGLSA